MQHSREQPSRIEADSEIAAAAASLNVVRVKVQAFALGACYAGAAGVLFAHFARYVAPEDFNLNQSILFLAMLIIGGEGSIIGSVLGAVLVTMLPEWLRFLGQAYLTFFGMLMLGVLIFLPKGLVSLPFLQIQRLWR
jgi:branched-chain amino acid transport system permease protein